MFLIQVIVICAIFTQVGLGSQEQTLLLNYYFEVKLISLHVFDTGNSYLCNIQSYRLQTSK